MKDKRVSVRLPGKIAQALDKYCEDNYLDRSTVMRTALLHFEPLQKYLQETGNMKLDIDAIENILEIQNLSIDYESFESGDELAD